jgi:hypothetical protein
VLMLGQGRRSRSPIWHGASTPWCQPDNGTGKEKEEITLTTREGVIVGHV